MKNDPVESIKKLMDAMQQLVEAIKIQQEMVQMVMQQQLKTADFIIKMGKQMGYDEKPTDTTQSSH